MDTIDLRGLTFYGYHGADAEEQRLGQRFVVDVRLGLDRVEQIDVRVEKPSALVSGAPSGLMAVEIHRRRNPLEDADVPW